ncbi:MAG: hypothetical protein ACP5H3_00770 [Candidatus Aenigmatarchaeota archaeon]|jgi:hypothetical protein
MKDEEIPEVFWKIAKARFEKMPSHLRLFIGGIGSLTKEKILDEIEKRSEIGKLLVKMQLEYLKLFKEEAESYEKTFDYTTRV